MEPAQSESIRQSMRVTARLVQKMREQLVRPSLVLKDCVRPDMFDDIVTAVRSIAKTETDESNRPRQKIPSVGIENWTVP